MQAIDLQHHSRIMSQKYSDAFKEWRLHVPFIPNPSSSALNQQSAKK